MPRAGYDKASGVCAGRSQPGAQALMAWALATYDNASNLGIYNCRNARGSTNKSVHADGRALDVAFPLDDGLANPIGHDLCARLTAHADVTGVQLVIFDGAIWTSKTKKWAKHCGHAGATGPHTRCSGPHRDHVHVEITWAAAKGVEALTVAEIQRLLGPPIAPPEDIVTPEDIEKVAQRVKALLMADDALGPVRHHIAGKADDGARLPRALRDLDAVKEAHGLTD